MAGHEEPSELGNTARQAPRYPCYGQRIADEIEANRIPAWDSEAARLRYERDRRKREKNV